MQGHPHILGHGEMSSQCFRPLPTENNVMETQSDSWLLNCKYASSPCFKSFGHPWNTKLLVNRKKSKNCYFDILSTMIQWVYQIIDSLTTFIKKITCLQAEKISLKFIIYSHLISLWWQRETISLKDSATITWLKRVQVCSLLWLDKLL